MKITPLASEINLYAEQAPRSEGTHISDIYNSLYQTLDPRRYRKDAPLDYTRMALGTAWEQYLERQLIAQGINADRPGELWSPDNFYYSPDLFMLTPQFRIGEIKLTTMESRDWPRKPANGLPPKFDKWLAQLMIYCSETQTPYATLFPYFVNGQGKRTQNKPEFLPIELEFSARELADNRAALLQHGRSKGLL